MVRKLLLASAVSFLAFSCVPKKVPIEASSTIEDLPNEVVDAGAAETAAAPEKKDEAAAPVVAFVKYEAAEGFSVSMPKDPQVQRGSVTLKKGSVSTLTVTANVEGVIYSVTRAEYPEAVAKKAGPKKLLTQTREDLAKAAKGTVSDEKELELAGHPGETFSIAGAANMIKARSAVVKNQLFSLIVVYAGKQPEKADEFLNSIEVKDAPAAAVPIAKP